MSDTLNPHTSNTAQVDRYGAGSARPIQPYRANVLHATAMSAPTAPNQCVVAGRARQVEFIVVPPPGVTAYTAHVGRWVRDVTWAKVTALPSPPADGELHDPLDDSVEIDSVSVSSGIPVSIVINTHTDPVWVFVDTLTGSANANTGFRFFWRALDA